MAAARTGRIVGAIAATALSGIVLADGPSSPGRQAALDLARAVTIKSDQVAVDPGGLEAAGVDPGSFAAPKRVKGGSPTYPESAARDNAQGTVVLECIITDTGAVQGCRVTRSVHPAADREAVRTIQRWKYEPARIMAQPRSIVAEFKMIFRLE
jgi:TonB family protein